MRTDVVSLLVGVTRPRDMRYRTTNEWRLNAVRLMQKTLDIFSALKQTTQSNRVSILLPTAQTIFRDETKTFSYLRLS